MKKIISGANNQEIEALRDVVSELVKDVKKLQEKTTLNDRRISQIIREYIRLDCALENMRKEKQHYWNTDNCYNGNYYFKKVSGEWYTLNDRYIYANSARSEVAEVYKEKVWDYLRLNLEYKTNPTLAAKLLHHLANEIEGGTNNVL